MLDVLVAKNAKGATYSDYFTVVNDALPGTLPNNTTPAQPTTNAPSGTNTGARPTGSSTPSGTNASGSQAPAKPTNAGNGLKAGMVGVAGAVGVAALLF